MQEKESGATEMDREDGVSKERITATRVGMAFGFVFGFFIGAIAMAVAVIQSR